MASFKRKEEREDRRAALLPGVGKEFRYDGRGGDGDRKGMACIGPRLWRTAIAIGRGCGGGRGAIHGERRGG